MHHVHGAFQRISHGEAIGQVNSRQAGAHLRVRRVRLFRSHIPRLACIWRLWTVCTICVGSLPMWQVQVDAHMPMCLQTIRCTGDPRGDLSEKRATIARQRDERGTPAAPVDQCNCSGKIWQRDWNHVSVLCLRVHPQGCGGGLYH